MKQLIQNFKSGELILEEVPLPMLRQGFVLVENVYSLISAGTEKSTVEIGKASLLEKAKKRPELAKQVMQSIQKEGLLATLQKVNTKLDTPKALGYSCSGVVMDSKDYSARFSKGERVACAGQDYASHAQAVSVPENLTVKIPENVSFEEAAFSAVGAIAVQAVRQADIHLGEKVCVIGLGLIGQIICQLLKAGGCSVFGVDLAEYRIDLAKKLGVDFALNRKDLNLGSQMEAFTQARGVDKVIISASTFTNDPIVLATEMLRKKGILVIVGDVKMDIPREPHFYKKELEMRISTSLGPGRYDSNYEEAGIDYPYPYVRFTENRNMDTFLGLVSQGKLKLRPLITHVFDFDQAQKAFDAVLDEKKDSLAVLFKYTAQRQEAYVSKIGVNAAPEKEINIGFIGAGSFAQSYLLPNLKRKDVSLNTVVTTQAKNAKNIARKFGFGFASCSPADIINNPKINTCFIATRHDTHSLYVCGALEAGKHVFVEKPLAVNKEELRKIVSVYKGEKILCCGFNRRFSDVSRRIKINLGERHAPLVMNFRVNAGALPHGHWTKDIDTQGGRIIGEACHFIDLMSYFSGALPKSVFASAIKSASGQNDNLAAIIDFSDGSVGNLIYTSLGDTKMEKERLEIFSAGRSYVINDPKYRSKGKGHREEIEAFLQAVRGKVALPIEFESLVATTLATFKIIESLKQSSPVEINIGELY